MKKFIKKLFYSHTYIQRKCAWDSFRHPSKGWVDTYVCTKCGKLIESPVIPPNYIYPNE